MARHRSGVAASDLTDPSDRTDRSDSLRRPRGPGDGCSVVRSLAAFRGAPDGLRWFGELTTGCGPYEWSGGAATCGHLRCAASAIGPGGAWGTAWSNLTRGGFTFVM